MAPKELDGVCYGLSVKYIDAYFSNDREKFYKRVNLLIAFSENKSKLFEKIQEIRQKVSNQQVISEIEQDCLEIPVFLENILFQQSPEHFNDLMNHGFFSDTNQDLKRYHSYTKPRALENSKLKLAFRSHHILKRQELANYLATMRAKISSVDEKVALLINSGDHATVLTYNTKQPKWEFMDINCLMNEYFIKHFNDVGIDKALEIEPGKLFKHGYFHKEITDEAELANLLFKSHSRTETAHMKIQFEGLQLQGNNKKINLLQTEQTNPAYNFITEYGVYLFVALGEALIIGSIGLFSISLSLGIIVSLTTLSLVCGMLYLMSSLKIEKIYDWFSPEEPQAVACTQTGVQPV